MGDAPELLADLDPAPCLLEIGKSYILFSKCSGVLQGRRHPGSLEQRICVLETFLPAYCVGSSVAMSEATSPPEGHSRSKWDRLPFVWMTLLIPSISEFEMSLMALVDVCRV